MPGDARAIGALRRFAGAAADTRCELCAATLGEPHAHLLEAASRRLACACEPCAILFAEAVAGAAGPRFRRVPRRIEPWPEFVLTDASWEALELPVGLVAFVRREPPEAAVALYPGPAGALEASPPREAWAALEAANPRLAGLAPEVEALLVDRRTASGACWRVPIDECFRLVGLIRREWRGVSGGDAARAAIDGFFAELRARAGGVHGA